MRSAGPLTMVLGYLSFGCTPVFLRLALLGGWDAAGSMVVRFMVAALLTAAITLAAAAFADGTSELTLRPVNRNGLVWRGLFGGVAVVTYFYAVQLTGAGLGTLLNYT